MVKTISSIVTKSMSKQSCKLHRSPYTHYLPFKDKSTLMCQKCISQIESQQQLIQNKNKKRQSFQKTIFLKQIKNSYKLENILQNPILLILSFDQLNKQEDKLDQDSLDDVSSSFINCKQDFQSKNQQVLEKSKCVTKKEIQLLINSSFLINNDFSILKKLMNQIKQRVSEYCQVILEQYKTKLNKYSEGQSYNDVINSINRMNNQYRERFEEILSQKFVNGTHNQLINSFKQFRNNSINPTSKLLEYSNKFEQIIREQQLINWDKIQLLYQQITNPQLWKFKNFFNQSTCEQKIRSNSVILPDELTKLNCIKSFLQYRLQQSEIKLYQQKSQINKNTSLMNSKLGYSNISVDISIINNQLGIKSQKVSTLNINQVCKDLNQNIDFLQQISGYKIVGVSYNHLFIFKYSFSTLKMINNYHIVGCTEVLDFQGKCLIVLSRNKVLRIWLNNNQKYVQTINFDVQSISKINNFMFQMIEKDNKKIIHSAFGSIKQS